MAQLVLKIISNNYLSVILLKIIVHAQKNISYIFLLVLLTVVCIDNKFSKKVVLYRGKNSVYKLIEAILSTVRGEGVIKKHFNKNLIMSTEEEDFN